MIDKKNRKQITFDVTNEMHQQVKILAIVRNISMTLWIARAITDRIAKETKHEDKQNG